MDSPSAAPPLQEPQAEGTSLLQILLILRRRWRLLAMVWMVTVAAVGIYTFTTRRLYRPQASLEIRPETPLVSSETSDAALMASRINYENYYRTQEQILTSSSLLEAVFKSLPEAIRAKYKDVPDPLKAFSDRLDIEKVRTSFILKVGFVDQDKEAATQIVNAIVSLYLEDANRRLRDLKSGAVEVMSKETLPAIRARVDDADKALQAFQTETKYVDFEEHYRSLLEAHRKIDSRFLEIKLRRVKVKAELDALSIYGADGVSGLFNPAFHLTTALQPLAGERARISSELGKIEKLYKERHPAVQELREQLRMVEDKISEAIRGTLKALQTNLAEAESEEKALREELHAVEDGMADSARRLNQFKRLDSELISAKELYHSYLKKHGETAATSSSALGSVRVVDHATIPAVPFKPKVTTNLMIAAVLGLLFGLGAVFIIEQLDDRIASPKEVEAFVGLDVLAMIPRLSLSEGAGEDPILLAEDSALSEFEAFRGLRAELISRLDKVEGCKVVCILSAVQSEGKSTVTANLAKVLAMEGRRVLVLDVDLRRPSQLKLIGARTDIGLEQVLRGEATADDCVQQTTRIAGVHVLGAQQGTVGAAELAGNVRLEQTLQWSRQRYDFVLIDSAPVNQVSESSLVARHADLTLLIVREGTSRGAAMAARKRLVSMGVRLAGAVMNGSSFQGSGYGYYTAYYAETASARKS